MVSAGSIKLVGLHGYEWTVPAAVIVFSRSTLSLVQLQWYRYMRIRAKSISERSGIAFGGSEGDPEDKIETCAVAVAMAYMCTSGLVPRREDRSKVSAALTAFPKTNSGPMHLQLRTFACSTLQYFRDTTDGFRRQSR